MPRDSAVVASGIVFYSRRSRAGVPSFGRHGIGGWFLFFPHTYLHFARAFLDGDSLVFFASFFCMTFHVTSSLRSFLALALLLPLIGERHLGIGDTSPLRWIGGFWSITSSRQTMVPARIWNLEGHWTWGGVWVFLSFFDGIGSSGWSGRGIGKYLLSRAWGFTLFLLFSLRAIVKGSWWVGRHGTGLVVVWLDRTHGLGGAPGCG
ncbi:hypothetical protein B0I37DRAFT_4055 [Chaetomium sp. MPI-CAGE-AT-0009]|nr:hypothetical protein B0I37DRAFT_4055 [Chaetomium sp. MPI-CAGE-AT-0009]